jgi:Uma2 family endonuclease
MTLIGSSPRRRPKPAWDIALLYPPQGQWDESDYLRATETTNQLVELGDGHIEVLTMPTPAHQRIVAFFYGALLSYLAENPVGEALFAPLRVRLWENTFREPDVVFAFNKNPGRSDMAYWHGADLVMEVVSGTAEDRRRDLVVKRREYAKAGIDEYWTIDPKEKAIAVLKRRGKTYMAYSEAHKTGRVASALLRGFEVDVSAVFSAAMH